MIKTVSDNSKRVCYRKQKLNQERKINIYTYQSSTLIYKITKVITHNYFTKNY